MKTQKDSRSSSREVFGCSGQQLDAIMQFAEKRCYDERPLHWVVAQYFRLPAHSVIVCGAA
ncbi:hypothetical protein [Caballeronia sp. LZ032]|uniref:hypothetical protein n=1 Tax=Caballeronia sp. LZ032 TaxID=3038565 RepID=UPI00285E5282|nr:hypothetical protein [Caballeronia sp. LZ032]MDR5880453.1 hypothetical protein [Caballeronia sp. LZ032]